jgi:type II secretory pathway pseudopilin PulG
MEGSVRILRRTKGITSPESIAVIVIATIMAAIVLFSLAAYAGKAEDMGARVEARMILTALQVHAAEQGLASVTLDEAAELEPIATAVSTLITDAINAPNGSSDTQVILRVTLNSESKVVELTYVSSSGKTVLYDGDDFTVQ